MDIYEYNRIAWNFQSREGCRWSTPVPAETIERAKSGDWEVSLTPNKPAPCDWFPRMADCDLLCLASGGGQQAPVFAAAERVSLPSMPRTCNWKKTRKRRAGTVWRSRSNRATWPTCPDSTMPRSI